MPLLRSLKSEVRFIGILLQTEDKDLFIKITQHYITELFQLKYTLCVYKYTLCAYCTFLGVKHN